MKEKKLFIVLILLAVINSIFAQEFNIDSQYKQAMGNAKLAFEAKDYSTAVLFYREAQKIKPDALLPRYKIEDIRTIYIEKELKSTPEQVNKNVKSKRKKKELEQEKAENKRIAEEKATKKMNDDADMALAELKNINVELIEVDELEEDLNMADKAEIEPLEENKNANIEIRTTKIIENENDLKLNDKEKIESIISNKESNLKIKATEIQEDEDDLLIDVVDKVSDIEEDKNAELEIKVVDIEEDKESLEDNSEIELVNSQKIPDKLPEKKPEVVPVKTEKADAMPQSAAEKQVWIKNEKKRLATVYSNKKTVEEIVKPGKYITRVIMNIDNDITIYLKVKHSWGATFFFIDEVGQELRSINEQYFNLMTNLKTYGY